ncbi:MAG: sulfatase, partial [bacterium]
MTPLRERQLALKVDRPTKLHVGFGARVVGPGEGRVTFELVAQKGTEETRLIHETVSVTKKSSAWHDRLVDLRPWVGEGVKLTFSIRPHTTHEHLTAAWSTPYPTSPPASVASRPHVILISLDTLRADHLSGWGYRRLTSPYIDALAQQGTRFSNHWSTANWTLPSHMSMLTGRYAFNHLVGLKVGGIKKARINLLDPAIPTLAEILKEQGYVTIAVTGGGWVSPEWFKRGFLRYRASKKGHRELPWDLEEKLEAVRRLLESHESERLFLFFHTYNPHMPYLGRFFLQDERIPATRRELRKPYPNVVVAKALYDGDIKITDEYIGLLLQLLDKKGILHNSILVLTSDHGEAFGEHGQRLHHVTFFDEELYVPLILVYPARVPADRTVENLTRGVDITPTILDLLDISPPAPLDGKSLLPFIKGHGGDHRTVLIDSEGRWKYTGAKALRT